MTSDGVRALSRDFTPDTERKRLQQLVTYSFLPELSKDYEAASTQNRCFLGLPTTRFDWVAFHKTGVQSVFDEKRSQEESALSRLVHGWLVCGASHTNLQMFLHQMRNDLHLRAAKTVREADLKPPLISDGIRKVTFC